MFALNTSFDATRLDTPFYLVHGWDAQGTVSSMLGPTPSSLPERTAYEWRRKFQRDYGYARACAQDLQKKAKRLRSEAQTEAFKIWIREGRRSVPKVQPGLSRTFAHLWHGPFRIDEVHDDFRVKLKIDGTGDRVNPLVHMVERILDLRWIKRTRTSRRTKEYLVKWKGYVDPKRIPLSQLNCGALLYEFNQGARARARFRVMQADGWEANNKDDQYEVERILDIRWIKRTRTSRRTKEYLVKWKGYADPEWIPLSQLNCGALLYEFNQGARARARFRAMQAGDDHPQL
ncbi:hypothetical protein PHMEG_00036287 [Phytophthora megakarya]|uniref:Chromo domain-containing protein n=1 Tax=Phytophthora megakarya TaxID=4795 RepID=A0A225UM44_9STRA|nr:hypothetical protein PHMEG_00036287 [Phytophthora megakarya]